MTKQKSPSKDTEGLGAPNHSTRDQLPTRDIGLEVEVGYQTGPKISGSLAIKIELKWQTKLTLDQLKETSKDLLAPENCPKLSVPLKNKVFLQLSNTQKKADLRLRNLQKNIKKATIALVQVTGNLLQDKGETKAMLKIILMQFSLLWGIPYRSYQL